MMKKRKRKKETKEKKKRTGIGKDFIRKIILYDTNRGKKIKKKVKNLQNVHKKNAIAEKELEGR